MAAAINNHDFFKGRGSQINVNNKFKKNSYVAEHIEGIDEVFLENTATEYLKENPKKIITTSNSPDLALGYSVNPYQGCEHGCIYCYARNAHEYWGYSAGLDFERKILVKENAAQLLEKELNRKDYQPQPIMLSGNTDCYQPAERKFKITEAILKVLLKYKNPVSIITKNNLILRDVELLQALNELDLLHVNISITSLREEIRQKLEPRTVTAKGRLKVIEVLANLNIPVRVMVAPIIPGLNSDEIPDIIKAAAAAGASAAGYTIVRLNGAIAEIFTDWVYKAYPAAADKIINQIKACHDGKLNDSRWGKRIKGDGIVADAIKQLYLLSVKKHLKDRFMKPYNFANFSNIHKSQLNLFS